MADISFKMPGNRKSIRLARYDYTSDGAYFVTICTKNRSCLFGNVVNGAMVLNGAGKMIDRTWRELPDKYLANSIDEFCIMPNHVHGIITIEPDPTVGAAPCGRPEIISNNHEKQIEDEGQKQNKGQPQGVAPTDEERMSLADIVHRIKSWTTKLYSVGVKQNGWETFPGRLWQRNYYERIIRNEDELSRIREYILENPVNWDEDRYNPLNTK